MSNSFSRQDSRRDEGIGDNKRDLCDSFKGFCYSLQEEHGVLVTNQQEEILFANESAIRLLGEKVTGLPLAQVLPELSEVVNKERTFSVRPRGNKDVFLHCRSMPVFWKENISTLILMRDMVPFEGFRCRLAEIERLSEIGKMCAVVAHEIRNPLVGVKTMLHSLEARAGSADLLGDIQLVQVEVDRLMGLLSNFLVYARQGPPRRRKTDIAALVEKVRLIAGERLDALFFRTQFNNLRPVFLDPDQIQQVFLNLLINAIDASEEGGYIEVAASIKDREVVIHVVDNGNGMPPEVQQRVFEAFSTTKPHGTGLGLFVCNQIVRAHGGTITFKSAPGDGTTFSIVLPLVESGQGEI